MSLFFSALWAETLKARRSRIFLVTAAGISILPIVDGLFMVILKDPEQAREMGLIGMKAQLAAGVADWPTFFQVLLLGTAIGGAILFAFITAWVFGREFSDHTVKELLATPTPRGIIVGAKFLLIALWVLALTLLIFGIGLGIGRAVDIPGWSLTLEWKSFFSLMTSTLLTFMLMPMVALFASAGRGYLPPIGWAFLTMVFAQIAGTLGWGDWFPWSVPGLISELAGTRSAQIGMHSYIMVGLVFIAGIVATFAWWQRADQAR